MDPEDIVDSESSTDSDRPHFLKSLTPSAECINSPENKIPKRSSSPDLNLDDSSDDIEISTDEEEVALHAKSFVPRIVNCSDDLLSASTDSEAELSLSPNTPANFLTPLRFFTPLTSAPGLKVDPRKTRANADNLLRRSADPLFYATNLFSPHRVMSLKDKRADWMAELREAQRLDEDPEFAALIDQLSEAGTLELEETLDLYLFQGKIILPKAQRQDVLMNIHGLPHCGHPTLASSLKALENSDYWWPSAKEDLTSHIQHCPSCQKNSNLPSARNTAQTTGNLIARRPFESLHVDTIGPLPEDVSKYKYVVVFVDSFTRFTVLVPLAKLNASEVAFALLEKVCSIFGIPASVHSDNGPEYANHIFEELCDFLNISESTAIPHYHQSNGVAERRNRDVLHTLRKLLADFNDYDNWSGYLPMTQLLINCTKCRRTGFTPFEMVFGTDSTIDPRNPPTKILEKLTNSSIPATSWLRTIESVSASLIEKWEKAETNLNPPTLPQSNNVDHLFKEGSYVLRAFDKSAKLQSPWKGPLLSH
ncbi:hypothetical protein GEMRC1_002477 [Eukaryota sp. GEM-RC1]